MSPAPIAIIDESGQPRPRIGDSATTRNRLDFPARPRWVRGRGGFAASVRARSILLGEKSYHGNGAALRVLSNFFRIRVKFGFITYHHVRLTNRVLGSFFPEDIYSAEGVGSCASLSMKEFGFR